jgi:hypothetical protein
VEGAPKVERLAPRDRIVQGRPSPRGLHAGLRRRARRPLLPMPLVSSPSDAPSGVRLSTKAGAEACNARLSAASDHRTTPVHPWQKQRAPGAR